MRTQGPKSQPFIPPLAPTHSASHACLRNADYCTADYADGRIVRKGSHPCLRTKLTGSPGQNTDEDHKAGRRACKRESAHRNPFRCLPRRNVALKQRLWSATVGVPIHERQVKAVRLCAAAFWCGWTGAPTHTLSSIPEPGSDALPHISAGLVETLTWYFSSLFYLDNLRPASFLCLKRMVLRWLDGGRYIMINNLW